MAERLNAHVAGRLEEVARLLAEQGANPFRVEAYARAAETLRRLAVPVTEILQSQGLVGLEWLPGIGPSIARSVGDLATTGRLPMLERLRGESDPLSLLASVPGVPDEPSVEELLSVDREYRTKGRRGELKLIAPRRFNPAGEAWLPVLHTARGDRDYTALFSNTARAHQFGRTHDWVVLYSDGGRTERQYTVVTARLGALKGRRIVRGREVECADYYAQRGARQAAPAAMSA